MRKFIVQFGDFEPQRHKGHKEAQRNTGKEFDNLITCRAESSALLVKARAQAMQAGVLIVRDMRSPLCSFVPSCLSGSCIELGESN